MSREGFNPHSAPVIKRDRGGNDKRPVRFKCRISKKFTDRKDFMAQPIELPGKGIVRRDAAIKFLAGEVGESKEEE